MADQIGAHTSLETSTDVLVGCWFLRYRLNRRLYRSRIGTARVLSRLPERDDVERAPPPHTRWLSPSPALVDAGREVQSSFARVLS
jgi:hypothetical protein